MTSSLVSSNKGMRTWFKSNERTNETKSATSTRPIHGRREKARRNGRGMISFLFGSKRKMRREKNIDITVRDEKKDRHTHTHTHTKELIGERKEERRRRRRWRKCGSRRVAGDGGRTEEMRTPFIRRRGFFLLFCCTSTGLLSSLACQKKTEKKGRPELWMIASTLCRVADPGRPFYHPQPSVSTEIPFLSLSLSFLSLISFGLLSLLLSGPSFFAKKKALKFDSEFSFLNSSLEFIYERH